ncbi:MAG: DUF2332 domain-containing protein [Anaerolineae bacterium]|nr:DUF2332 domain-containing protein [Anaerolineae bacterium]
MTQQDALLDNLARRFEHMGSSVYGVTNVVNASPLYAALSLGAAQDRETLSLLLYADQRQQLGNLLFGAVHYLLLGGIQHPIAEYFASLNSAPHPPDDAYPLFQAFCREYADAIRALVNTRSVQTNEVRRCACWIPAFVMLAQRTGQPLALVEMGSSAGLNLLFRHYGYHYSDGRKTGDLQSPIQLACEVRGDKPPPLAEALPAVVSQIGIDLNPVNLHDPDTVRWLRALVWPEHRDRAALLDRALTVAAGHSLEVISGNALDVLPDVLANTPRDAALCIFHSYTLVYFSKDERNALAQLLLTHSAHRPVYRLSMEWLAGQDGPQIELHSYLNGETQMELLAYAESHGRWIEWLA